MRRWIALPFFLVFIVHQIGLLTDGRELATFTKPFLVPLIACAFLVWVHGLTKDERFVHWKPTVMLAVFAMFFSWLGDIFLMISGEIWFIAGLSMFLIAQLFFIALFLKRIRKHTSFRPWSLLYALWYAGLMVLLVPYTGSMLIPVTLYGAALALMGLLASRNNGFILLGGLLFMLSDSILAVNKFVPKEIVTITSSGFWVMFTYSLAQFLLAYGIYQYLKSTIDKKETHSHLE